MKVIGEKLNEWSRPYRGDKYPWRHNGTVLLDSRVWKVVPLTEPCPRHATGDDCFHWDCKCEEIKLVRRSAQEVDRIVRDIKQAMEDDQLEAAERIRASRGGSDPMS